MEFARLDEAIELLEKANAALESEPLTAPEARWLLDAYVRIDELAASMQAAISLELASRDEPIEQPGEAAGQDENR